jgi:serine phosphatase RsbU (regulator of sigma subunit)
MEIWGGNQAFDNAVAVSGVDVWIVSRPFQGDRDGGDIHYISTCGHGRIARFAVADVQGHGVDAAAVGERLRQLMRKHINTLDQARFVRTLNEDLLAHSGDEDRFATALLTSFYAPTHHLVVCNAGHPPPLWYRAATGTWEFIVADTSRRVDKLYNLPLGVIQPTEYEQFAIQLDTNDVVLLYTDWLIESRSPDGALLGNDGLLDLLRDIDAGRPDHLAGRLIAAVDEFRGHQPPDDDMTLVVLHHIGTPAPRLSPLEYITVLGKALHLIPV